MELNRSRFLTVTAAALAASGTPAGAQDRASIRLGTTAVESFSMPLFAKENGFFDKAGLDVDITIMNGGGATMAALAGGALDIVLSNVGSISSAYARGLPVALIFPGAYYTSAHPTTALLVAKNSPLRTAADLNGKVVAVSGLRDLVQISCMKWSDSNGGDASTIKWTEMPTAAMCPALVAGRVDAAIVVEPEITSNAATTRIFAKNYDAIAKTLMISGNVATKTWLDKNPDVARRYVAVMRQTAEWMNKNTDKFAPVLAKYSKIDPALIAAEQHAVFGTALDPKVIQPIIDAAAQYKVLPAPFNASDLFYPPLAPKA